MSARAPSRSNRTSRRFLLLLALLAAGPAVPSPLPGAEGFAGKRVRHILIDHKDIFDTSLPAENKLFYRTVNRLHFSTRDKAIRHQLLIREGDAFNPLLVRESERLLRKLFRLRRVRITPRPVDDAQVDLLVEVQETWTTEPTLTLSGVGSKVYGKIGLRERNFLGRGTETAFFYKRDETGRISRSLSYSDPDLGARRIKLDVNYDQKEEGIGRSLALERPFYSSITPWSAAFEGVSDVETSRLYDNGREVLKFRHTEKDMSAGYARSLGSTPRRIHRAGLGYRYRRDSLLTEGPGAADLRDDTYHMANLSFHEERVRFLTVDRIKLYDREEDFALGPSLQGIVGISRNWVRGSQPATFLELKSFAGRERGPTDFGLATMENTGRFEDGAWRDTLSRLDLEYYNHFHPRQTLALHLEAQYLARPAPESQILLGGDRGLRGYQLNQFAGNKLLLLNVENRFFLVDDILKLMGLGAVAFYDAGYVWDRGRAIRARDVKMDVGTGLRFYLSRSSVGQCLRLDVAYAVKEVKGESRWVVTFGSSQAF